MTKPHLASAVRSYVADYDDVFDRIARKTPIAILSAFFDQVIEALKRDDQRMALCMAKAGKERAEKFYKEAGNEHKN